MSKQRKVSFRISEQLFNELENLRKFQYLNISTLMRHLVTSYILEKRHE